MDFHTLSRKELQALCKKNRIPANMTNVAMANALQALQHVEGLDELLNPSESNGQQTPERNATGNPAAPRTSCRTSTRRNLAKEPQSSRPLTQSRRVTRRKAHEEADQENKADNISETPAVRTGRRRAPAVSALQKMETNSREDENNEKDVMKEKSEKLETPAIASRRRRAPAGSASSRTENKTGTSVQKAYSTRRSVRLLEKSMAELSLEVNEENEPVKVDQLTREMSKDLDEVADEKGSDLLALSKGQSVITSDIDVNEKEDIVNDKDVEYNAQADSGTVANEEVNKKDPDDSTHLAEISDSETAVYTENKTTFEKGTECSTESNEMKGMAEQENKKESVAADEDVGSENSVTVPAREKCQEASDEETSNATDEIVAKLQDTSCKLSDTGASDSEDKECQDDSEQLVAEADAITAFSGLTTDSDEKIALTTVENVTKLQDSSGESSDTAATACKNEPFDTDINLDGGKCEEVSEVLDAEADFMTASRGLTADEEVTTPYHISSESSDTDASDSEEKSTEMEMNLDGKKCEESLDQLVVEADVISVSPAYNTHGNDSSYGTAENFKEQVSAVYKEQQSSSYVVGDSTMKIEELVDVNVAEAQDIVVQTHDISTEFSDTDASDSEEKSTEMEMNLDGKKCEKSLDELVVEADVISVSPAYNTLGNDSSYGTAENFKEQVSAVYKEQQSSSYVVGDSTMKMEVDVNVAEAQDIVVQTHKCPLSGTSAERLEPKMQDFGDFESLVDVDVMPEVEFSMPSNDLPSSIESPAPQKQKTPFSPLSGSKVGEMVHSPIVSELLAGRLLRQTPVKSATKTQVSAKKTPLVSDNKENVDNGDRKMNTGIVRIEQEQKFAQYENMSIRQLTKLLKEKLKVTETKDQSINKHLEVKARKALQTLPGNGTAVDESQN